MFHRPRHLWAATLAFAILAFALLTALPLKAQERLLDDRPPAGSPYFFVRSDDPSVDAYTPVYSKSYTTSDARFGYTWKLRDRRTVQLNLNIQNLFNNTTPMYFVNLPGGQTTNTILRNRNADVTSPAVYTVPAGFSYRTPINWTLSARLDF